VITGAVIALPCAVLMGIGIAQLRGPPWLSFIVCGTMAWFIMELGKTAGFP
jgi:hypothetical protein